MIIHDAVVEHPVMGKRMAGWHSQLLSLNPEFPVESRSIHKNGRDRPQAVNFPCLRREALVGL